MAARRGAGAEDIVTKPSARKGKDTDLSRGPEGSLPGGSLLVARAEEIGFAGLADCLHELLAAVSKGARRETRRALSRARTFVGIVKQGARTGLNWKDDQHPDFQPFQPEPGATLIAMLDDLEEMLRSIDDNGEIDEKSSERIELWVLDLRRRADAQRALDVLGAAPQEAPLPPTDAEDDGGGADPKDEHDWAKDEEPLSSREWKLLEFLFELPCAAGLNGAELVAKIPGLTQSDLTSRLIRGLRAMGWEIPNRARVGYYLSASDRERFRRLRST